MSSRIVSDFFSFSPPFLSPNLAPSIHRCITEIGSAIEVTYARTGVKVTISNLIFSNDNAQAVAARNQYEVVKNFCGHGTGKYIHMDPLVSAPSVLVIFLY